MTAKAATNASQYTSIFLLKRFTTNDASWVIQAADVIEGTTGSYAMEYVRDGTYWPLAVQYANEERTLIEALGFYDEDGDGEPDPVSVSGSDRPNIDVTLFNYPLTTIEENLVEANNAAGQEASDHELVYVQSQEGSQTDGTAHVWLYQYYSPLSDIATEVTVSPIGIETSTESAPSYVKSMSFFPESFIDSDEALQIALNDGGQDFIDNHSGYDIFTSIEGGNIFWTVNPSSTDSVFWRLQFFATQGSDVDIFQKYLDIETGAVLDPTSLPVELVAFDAVVNESDVILKWTTASETNNAGFDVEHQAPDADRFATVSFVEGAGTTSEMQQYRYRVDGLAPGKHRFRLRQVDFDGAFEYSSEVEVSVGLSQALAFEPPFPNPFSNRATLRFGVQQAGEVKVGLYNALGQQVDVLYQGRPSPGRMQEVTIDGEGLASGYYIVQIVSAGRTESHTIVHVR